MCYAGSIVTRGGLVLIGRTDGRLTALDKANGKLLWEFETTSGIVAPPSTFVVDGKQYLAVHSGWGGDPRGMQAGLNTLFPGEYPPVPEGGALYVFALEN